MNKYRAMYKMKKELAKLTKDFTKVVFALGQLDKEVQELKRLSGRNPVRKSNKGSGKSNEIKWLDPGGCQGGPGSA